MSLAIHENHTCFLSLGNLDEINPNDLTEEMVLDAFKEEVRFIGMKICAFFPIKKDFRFTIVVFPEFEGVNEQGSSLDDIHDAFLVLRENIRTKRLLKDNLAR